MLTMQKIQYAGSQSPQKVRNINTSIQNSPKLQQSQQHSNKYNMQNSYDLNQSKMNGSIFSQDQTKQQSYINSLQKRDAINLQLIQKSAAEKQKQEMQKREQLEKRKRIQDTYTNVIRSTSKLEDEYIYLLEQRKSQNMMKSSQNIMTSSQNQYQQNVYQQPAQEQFQYQQVKQSQSIELSKSNTKTSDTSDSLKQQFNAFTFDQPTNILSKGNQQNIQSQHQRQITTAIKKHEDQEHTRAMSYVGSAILLQNNNVEDQNDGDTIDLSVNDDMCHFGQNSQFYQQINKEGQQNQLVNSFSLPQQQNGFNQIQQNKYNYHDRQQSASITCGKPEDALDKNHTRQESYVGEGLISKHVNQPQQQVQNDDILDFSDSCNNTIKQSINPSFQHITTQPLVKSQTVYYTPEEYKQQNQSNNQQYKQYDQDYKDFLEISDSQNIIQNNNNNYNKQLYNSTVNVQANIQNNPFEQAQKYTIKSNQQQIHERQQSTLTCGPARSDEQDQHTRVESYVGDNIILKQKSQSSSYLDEDIDITAEIQQPNKDTSNYEFKSDTVEKIVTSSTDQQFNTLENPKRVKSRLQNELQVIQQEYICSQSEDVDMSLNRRQTSQYLPNLTQSNNDQQKLKIDVIQSPSQNTDNQLTAKFRPKQSFNSQSQEEVSNIDVENMQECDTAIQQDYSGEKVINSFDGDSQLQSSSISNQIIDQLLQLYMEIKQNNINEEQICQIRSKLDSLQQTIMYCPGEINCFSTFLYQLMLKLVLKLNDSSTQWILEKVRPNYKVQELIIYKLMKDVAKQQQKDQLEDIYKEYKLDEVKEDTNTADQSPLSSLESQQMQLVFYILTSEGQIKCDQDKEFLQFYKDIIKIMYNDNELVKSILK